MVKSGNNRDKTVLDERRLVKGCLKGDRKAWDAFVVTYQGLIYNAIIHTMLSVGYSTDDNVKNDLFQDVFALLLKNDREKLKSFQWKNGCSLASWLHIVSKNLTYDFLRSRRGKVKVAALSDDDIEINDASLKDGETFVSDLEEDETVCLLEEAMKGLPKEDMHIIDLIFYRHVSHSAVAVMLGKSVGAVYMQKRRIIEQLKRRLEKKEKGRV